MTWCSFALAEQTRCECTTIPPADFTEPKLDPCFKVGDAFRYTCIDGYVRKAGTSNLIRCKQSNGVAFWTTANLVCIRKFTFWLVSEKLHSLQTSLRQSKQLKPVHTLKDYTIVRVRQAAARVFFFSSAGSAYHSVLHLLINTLVMFRTFANVWSHIFWSL